MAKDTNAPRKPADPVQKDASGGGGKTKIEQGGESSPRLPHEHDQSSDSQRTRDGQPTERGRRAHDDIERGVVDTDRGPEADRVYNEKLKR